MRAAGGLPGWGGRRGLTMVVLLCAVAAVLVLVAVGRTWVVEVAPRPAPLPELVTARTGGTLRPWLPALGWVALAGAGALLATRGTGRRVVGGLLLFAGAGIAAGALTAVAGGWPVLTAAGGVAVGVAGALATAYGGRWPAMGARYERARPHDGGRAAPASGGDPEVGGAAGPGDGSRVRSGQWWDALDRGEDPTS